MKKKQTILAAAAVLLVLALAFWYGGDAPGLQGWSLSGSSAPASSSAPAGSDSSSPLPETGSASSQGGSEEAPAPATPEDSAAAREPAGGAQEPVSPDQSAPAPDASAPPEPTAPPSAHPDPEGASSSQEAEPEEASTACRISIVCSTVLDHLDWLAEGKADILPAGGVFLPATDVEPEEGETAFSLLQRVTRERGIPMEASFTPGTGSAYVEGIGNLYEFDCGQRSGWLYLVNGVSPGYSASEYTLKPGDRVEWVYTCDMGQDVGASAAGAGT